MFKIVTDSTCNLPPATIQKDITTMLASYIFFGSEEFREGVNISSEALQERLLVKKQVPMTAPPTSSEFVKHFLDISKDADAIFSIHISSKLSNIHKCASIAADIFNKQPKPKPCEVLVYDSQALDMGMGLVVLAAQDAVQKGKSKEDIKKIIENSIQKVKAYVYVDQLDFLVRGGRVSRLAGMMGSFLGMKPILSNSNGEIIARGKIKGQEKAIEQILDYMQQDIPPGAGIHAAVCDAAAKAEGDKLLSVIQTRFKCVKTYRTMLSPSVTSHAGTGAVGVFFLPAA